MNPTLSALAQWVEVMVNGALSLDRVAQARMLQLDGRSVLLSSTAPVEHLTIRCRGTRVLVAHEVGDAPNVIVRGTPQALFAAIAGVGSPDVEIEGDEVLLQELRTIVRDIEPDLSRPLAPLIGEEPAAALTGLLQAGAKAFRSLFTAVDAEGTRWVRSGLHSRFANDTQLDRLVENVSKLRLAVDRLDARTRVLEARPGRGQRRQ